MRRLVAADAIADPGELAAARDLSRRKARRIWWSDRGYGRPMRPDQKRDG